MNLHPQIQAAIKAQGYKKPTPIQEKSIPSVLEGRDLLGIAQTGTGKTAAFSLPILTKIAQENMRPARKKPKCLILTPTRELASQIKHNIDSYTKRLKITSTVVFGGVGHGAQIKAMTRGVDVLIATPGRLLDLMSSGYVRYTDLKYFILDEADRMLDMGFINDIKKIIAQLPNNKQTLLFSATMPNEILGLANSLLRNPLKVEVTPASTTVDRIKQTLNLVEKRNKPLLLSTILRKKNVRKTLVFTRTKHCADKVVKFLEREKVSSAAIHGNKTQGQRERALNGFRTGKIRVLIATDIASRGIDVDKVTHVINYEIPNEPESYVHRIGRTARAGRDGVAIAFCDETEVNYLNAIQKVIKYKIPVDKNHEYAISFSTNKNSNLNKKKGKRKKKSHFSRKINVKR